ncbi:MAG: 4-(cytidine 5'-diphospho)-2-C-methyl-D-erythritol kinase [Bacteroidia bacterium]|nr:MAG: 4-(cytidine 5'-diphospho)-2-C-methyl-D-erythritol kinase [Bacteroidia bacterium]
MIVFPKAKINLGLRITGRRPDGYHDIETVFYPVSLCDALEFVADSKEPGKDTINLSGSEIPGRMEDNIVLRAVRRLRETYPVPYLKIHLHKNIPSGAGLGGGSSDAAFILRAVNRAFSLALSSDDLKAIASGLGSDCSFFIDCQPAFASGRGEILTPVNAVLDNYYGVLVNPGISVSTREAYENCKPSKPENSLAELIKNPVSEWKNTIINDFEKTVIVTHPQIKDIKQTLYNCGAIYSSMSGSGSTVYGIFSKRPLIPSDLRKFVIFEGSLSTISDPVK